MYHSALSLFVTALPVLCDSSLGLQFSGCHVCFRVLWSEEIAACCFDMIQRREVEMEKRRKGVCCGSA